MILLKQPGYQVSKMSEALLFSNSPEIEKCTFTRIILIYDLFIPLADGYHKNVNFDHAT